MISLVQGCYACPEAYDALKNDEMVGYLRLRHGRFTVECPDSGGTLVYEAHPEGDGRFEDDERNYYLTEAVIAIELHLDPGLQIEDLKFTVDNE